MKSPFTAAMALLASLVALSTRETGKLTLVDIDNTKS